MRVEPFAEDALTADSILGGRVKLRQPIQGYRAGLDPVLLAAAVPAALGQTVLELGCGAGPALCCLGRRVPGLTLHGIELQPAYAALAQRNLVENGLTGQIWTGDIADPPAGLRAVSFDHVLANPPYFRPGTRAEASDGGREIALAGQTPLALWVTLAAKRLKPRGTVTFIQRADRLPELLSALSDHLGSVELLPLLPRTGRPPRLVLVRARKDGRAPFQFHAGLVLHNGDVHRGDREDYTAAIAAVVREAQPLLFSA